MSKPSELGALKIGSYILLPVDSPNAEPCKIVEYDTSKPGKHGAAKARIVGVGIFDRKKYPHVLEYLTGKNIHMYRQLVHRYRYRLLTNELGQLSQRLTQ